MNYDNMRLQPKQKEVFDILQPKQREKRYIGFGGEPACGKTWVINFLAMKFAMNFPMNILIIRPGDKTQVDHNHKEHIEEYLSDYIDDGSVKFKHVDYAYHFSDTNAVVKFFAVEKDEDIYSVAGTSWDLVLVDNAEGLGRKVLDYIMELRRPSMQQFKLSDEQRGLRYYSKVLYCFKIFKDDDLAPDEYGYKWLKDRFWGLLPGEQLPSFTFIPASWRDNNKFIKDNPDYVESLNKLDEPYRSAWLLGDPEAFEGEGVKP